MDEQVLQKISNLGVSKIRYYPYSTPLVNNLFTICLLLDDNKKPLSRGISICSLLDTHRKKEGKNRSFGRAVKAILSQKNSEIILVRPDRWEDEYVVRSFKEKSKKDSDYFTNIVLPEIPSNAIMRSIDVKRGSVTFKKHMIYLPRIHPIEVAVHFFSYKSEYQPTLNDFEKDWIDNCK